MLATNLATIEASFLLKQICTKFLFQLYNFFFNLSFKT